MKKSSLFFTAILVAAAALSACSSAEEGDPFNPITQISAYNIEDMEADQTGTVHFELSGYEDYDVATAPFSGGGFTMQLPATIPAIYLEPLAMQGVEITPAEAMLCECRLYARLDRSEGGIYEQSVTREVRVLYVYADRDARIRGVFTDGDFEEEYNVNLKKGWNRVAEIEVADDTKEKYLLSSHISSGLKWYYSRYDP